MECFGLDLRGLQAMTGNNNNNDPITQLNIDSIEHTYLLYPTATSYSSLRIHKPCLQTNFTFEDINHDPNSDNNTNTNNYDNYSNDSNSEDNDNDMMQDMPERKQMDNNDNSPNLRDLQKYTNPFMPYDAANTLKAIRDAQGRRIDFRNYRKQHSNHNDNYGHSHNDSINDNEMALFPWKESQSVSTIYGLLYLSSSQKQLYFISHNRSNVYYSDRANASATAAANLSDFNAANTANTINNDASDSKLERRDITVIDLPIDAPNASKATHAAAPEYIVSSELLPQPKDGEFVTNKQFRIVFGTSHGRMFLVPIVIDQFAEQMEHASDAYFWSKNQMSRSVKYDVQILLSGRSNSSSNVDNSDNEGASSSLSQEAGWSINSLFSKVSVGISGIAGIAGIGNGYGYSYGSRRYLNREMGRYYGRLQQLRTSGDKRERKWEVRDLCAGLGANRSNVVMYVLRRDSVDCVNVFHKRHELLWSYSLKPFLGSDSDRFDGESEREAVGLSLLGQGLSVLVGSSHVRYSVPRR